MIYNRTTGEPIGYTQNEREKALSVSLTSLAASMGYTPIKVSHYYHLKEMDSLTIYNDKTWYRWSKQGNRMGGTQIDFLMEFGNIDTPVKAIKKLLEFRGMNISVDDFGVNNNNITHSENLDKNDKGQLELPPQNKDYKRLYAYLMKTRGLSSDVISYMIHNKLIYEDANHHNIVFLGKNPQGDIKYAGVHGTVSLNGKSYKCDCRGNDKNYGVNIVNKQSDKLCVFEAVIDCMSYMDMTGDYASNKLVLGMVADNPLEQFLNDYSHIREINFCLDNDEAGQKAIYSDCGLFNKYNKLGYKCNVTVPDQGKDFNEALLLRKENLIHQTNTMNRYNRHGR